MKTQTKDRRRYSRDGLFAQIEDATYRVLRRMETRAVKPDGDELADFTEVRVIPAANATYGFAAWEQIGEPF